MAYGEPGKVGEKTQSAVRVPAHLAHVAAASLHVKGGASGSLSTVELRNLAKTRSFYRAMVRNKYAQITQPGMPDGPQ